MLQMTDDYDDVGNGRWKGMRKSLSKLCNLASLCSPHYKCHIIAKCTARLLCRVCRCMHTNPYVSLYSAVLLLMLHIFLLFPFWFEAAFVSVEFFYSLSLILYSFFTYPFHLKSFLFALSIFICVALVGNPRNAKHNNQMHNQRKVFIRLTILWNCNKRRIESRICS